MSHIDDPTIYNPFGWRLADIANPATNPRRRHELMEDLIVSEAEEIAHGYRHLTVLHGDPDDLDAVRQLAAFYETVRAFVAGEIWVRVRGGVDYVTVTVRGDDADDRIADFAAKAHDANPGQWQITSSAYPLPSWRCRS